VNKTGSRIRSFEPIVDRKSIILVLGTMPGPEALRKREYYGFRQNHFWRIMGDLFAAGGPLSYAQKVRLLRQNGIALWDVLQSCEREGAADSRIRNERPNDVPDLLARHPNIKAVYFNGKSAAKLFIKYFGDKRVRPPARSLPSTSPANAGISFEAKRKAWSIIKRCC